MMKPVPTRLEATNKIRERLNGKTYDDVAGEIGITKPTLYARLAEHSWKKSELVLIRDL